MSNLQKPSISELRFVRTTSGAYTLRETFEVGPLHGRTYHGELWACPSRPSARRIQVFDPDTREKVYDTDDCYDLGNAQHKAYAWAAEFMKQEPRDISDPAVVPTVAEALADPAGFVAGMEEFGGEG